MGEAAKLEEWRRREAARSRVDDSYPGGQGSFGSKCTVCWADDYYGPLVHKPGCDEAWVLVEKLRAA